MVADQVSLRKADKRRAKPTESTLLVSKVTPYYRMDQFNFNVFCKWAVIVPVQLFFILLIGMIGAKVLLETLHTIFPEKTEPNPERERNPEKIPKPKESSIEEIRKSGSLTKKPPVFNMDLRMNYKLDLLRTNRDLNATKKQLEATKGKVTELEKKIQLKDTQLQRASEELDQYKKRNEDFVVHNNDKKELARTNRILRRQKTGSQRGDPVSDESSSETTPVVAVVFSDPVVVHHLQVTELESRDNETANELIDQPEPDKSEDEETGGSSDTTNVRKENKEDFKSLADSDWYQYNGRFVMTVVTEEAEMQEIEPEIKSELDIEVNQVPKTVENPVTTQFSVEPEIKSEPEIEVNKVPKTVENPVTTQFSVEPKIKSEPEIEVNQVPKTVTTQFSVPAQATKPSTMATDDFTPQSRKPKKKGYFTRHGFLKSNTIDTTEKKPKIKLDKMKSLKISVNGQMTTMFVDKDNFYSAVNYELWKQQGRPKLNSLPKGWIKRYSNYKFLKARDFKGFFYAEIKLTNEGREIYFLPILVFYKKQMPNFIGRKYFYSLQLDRNKAPDFLVNNKKQNTTSKLNQVHDKLNAKIKRAKSKLYENGKKNLKKLFLK